MSTPTLKEIIAAKVKLTPMMEQYSELKMQHPDTLLLFRMGDFYELFFEDAHRASQILNIALTHRGKLGPYPIPMAGIPHHAAATYIDRITARGLKAVICEQIEDPKEAKGIVKRAVTQIVSPGMPYDIEKTSELEKRFMTACFQGENNFYTVFLDFTTGDFFGATAQTVEELMDYLRLHEPKEMISYLGQWNSYPQMEEFLEHSGILCTYLSEDYFSPLVNEPYLKRLVPLYQRDETLKVHQEILYPITALSYYIISTQALGEIKHLRPFKLQNRKGTMIVSLPTLCGLEILPRTKDDYKNSLLGFFDKTKTALGARKLKEWFISPLRDLASINKRQDTIELLASSPDKLESLREDLSQTRDLERILAKCSTKKANSNDLLNLERSLIEYEKIVEKIPHIPLQKIDCKEKQELLKLCTLIGSCINDEIGASLDKGNLIKEGYNSQRDKLARMSFHAAEEVIKLENRYKQETGVSTLRIKYNNVQGYFVEISKAQASKAPSYFERKQTLTNAERFTTEELDQFEKEVLAAKEKLGSLEKKIFDELVEQCMMNGSALQTIADNIATLDVFQSFAFITIQEELSRPIFEERNRILKVKKAWHPLIKKSIRERFVCHDLELNEKVHFGLITGPNMAGKTTVMREMAIIQYLGQLGAFVPAQKANLSLCDFLFSRLGASDDITRGQSTFMVEMSETAEIIRHASSESFIVLDEIGRGTSTYDGLSIAWSLVEYLTEKTKAFTLFSTHYHELIDLADQLKAAKNLTVETVSQKGEVKFLYRLLEKGAAQSFGIHVAKLAGLPQEILSRAEQILHNLEEEQYKTRQSSPQLSLLEEQIVSSAPNLLEKEIAEMDILNMTPLEAMNKLHDLKSKAIIKNN